MGDIISGLRLQKSVNVAVSGNGASNGTSIDTEEFGRGVAACLQVGGRTDGSYLLSMEDSADDISFAAIDSSKLIGSVSAVTADSTGALQKIGAFDTRRYVRAVVTASGVTIGATRVVATLIAGADLEPTT